MRPFNTALGFGQHMIEVGASTVTRLVEIQFEQLATVLEHQSDAMRKLANAPDVGAAFAVQREYQRVLWKDGVAAITATGDALLTATRKAGEGFKARSDRKAPDTRADSQDMAAAATGGDSQDMATAVSRSADAAGMSAAISETAMRADREAPDTRGDLPDTPPLVSQSADASGTSAGITGAATSEAPGL